MLNFEIERELEKSRKYQAQSEELVLQAYMEKLIDFTGI